MSWSDTLQSIFIVMYYYFVLLLIKKEVILSAVKHNVHHFQAEFGAGTKYTH